MRTTVLSITAFLLLLGAPELRANETAGTRAAAAEITPRMTGANAPTASELRLTKVQVEQRNVTPDDAAAQWPQRGSFWWLVGVIVVGGVILAILL